MFSSAIVDKANFTNFPKLEFYLHFVDYTAIFIPLLLTFTYNNNLSYLYSLRLIFPISLHSVLLEVRSPSPSKYDKCYQILAFQNP